MISRVSITTFPLCFKYSHFAIIVSGSLAQGWKGVVFSNGCLDGRTCTTSQVSKLIRSSHNESPETAGTELAEVDRNDAPGSLDAELFEEGGGDDAVIADEAVRIQQGATNNTDKDDTEPTSEDGTAISNDCASEHCAEIGDNLCDGYLVRGEAVLTAQHCWIQILASM